MAFIPENFVDGVGPVISAEFLNGIDATVNGALQGATTTAQLQAVLGTTILVATMPAIVLASDSNGNVTNFAQAFGQVQLFAGPDDVTSQAILSISTTNCTATLNTAVNVPVSGPIGFYQVTGFPAAAQDALIVIQAVFEGNTYTTQISLAKSEAGAPGASGSPGVPGPPGTPGAAGISLVLSSTAANLLTYANGTVPSFAGINGVAMVLNGGINVSEASTFSVVGSGLTGTINTADNAPVAGQPIGFYQVTAQSQPIATLTITAVYAGTTLTGVFTVTQVNIGFQIVATLPLVGSPAAFEGNVVFLQTDGQLYRFHSGAWTAGVPTANLTGTINGTTITAGTITQTQMGPNSIGTGQIIANSIVGADIQAGTITAGNIATGTITTNNIAAGAITAAVIAANTITAAQIATGTITANQIAAGTITADRMSVTQLSAIAASLGTVTAGVVQNAGGTVKSDYTNGWQIFNNGTFMLVMGVGFGAGSNYINWFGPTQSSVSNFAACTDALGIYWIKTDGTYKFGTSQQAPASTNYTGSGGVPQVFTVTIPAGKTTMTLELWGDTGTGLHGNTTIPTFGGGGGSGSMARSSYNVASAAGQTVTITLQSGATGNVSSIVSGTFSMTTMNTFTGANGTAGTSGSNGTPGAGGTIANGGNVVNAAGVDGGSAIGPQPSGAPVPGVYGQGNPGGRGNATAGTNNPGQPATATVTFT